MKISLLTIVILFFCLGATAQKISKKPLDYSVFDGWQSLANERISNNGKWVDKGVPAVDKGKHWGFALEK
jgi:hypothetical protein